MTTPHAAARRLEGTATPLSIRPVREVVGPRHLEEDLPICVVAERGTHLLARRLGPQEVQAQATPSLQTHVLQPAQPAPMGPGVWMARVALRTARPSAVSVRVCDSTW